MAGWYSSPRSPSLRGVPYAAHYAASKHGLLGLMRSLAAEYAKTNLTVNAVCPGYVDTPMTDQSVARVSQDHRPQGGRSRAAIITNMNASGRLVDPQAIGNVIAMLCLPLSRDINGAAVTIDGGTARDLRPATFNPTHFLWKFEDGVATVTLNRPERKNPLTFESYDELRDTFRALEGARQVKVVVLARRRRQFLLGRRRPRDHRPADQNGSRRAAQIHAHDRRPGARDARLPAADHRRGRGRVRRRRRDHGDGQRHSLRPAGLQDRLPVQPRRPVGRRHGRLRDPAAPHRPRPRRRAAVHRPEHDAATKASPGASTTAWSRM